MKRIAMTGLAVGLATLLGGCSLGERDGLERTFADAGRGAAVEQDWSAPHAPSSLPPGHPPITQGHAALPPGHPPIPEGVTCPGGGVAREPAGERFRTDRLETISI